MDVADACLIAMADELATPGILTLDKDFAIYRWGRSHATSTQVAENRAQCH